MDGSDALRHEAVMWVGVIAAKSALGESRGCNGLPVLFRGRSRVTMDVIIYHNAQCGTSRNTLGLIRNAGIEPHVIDYLKTPPTRALLVQLIGRMAIAVRDLVRVKGTPFHDLGLDRPGVGDAELLD